MRSRSARFRLIRFLSAIFEKEICFREGETCGTEGRMCRIESFKAGDAASGRVRLSLFLRAAGKGDLLSLPFLIIIYNRF